MEFPTFNAPHLPAQNSVARVMREVLLALLPGVACAIAFFGWGILINILLTASVCVLAEAAMLRLRGRPVRATLSDSSALLTGVLLALALPPLTPWWIPTIGALFAIVVAKQLYGGLGYNPFNPAMIGYVVLLISFPREMTLWNPATGLGAEQLNLGQTLAWIFTATLPNTSGLDSWTMATPLDSAKTAFGLGQTLHEIETSPLFGHWGGYAWEWINAAFLLGGLFLIYRRRIAWQIPAGMLGALFILALIFYASDTDAFISPLFHLFSGATMLGAFFIATDPVSASTTPRGRLLYGAGIGSLVYIIRTWGGYPDGVAFAVLLMNMAAPTLDYYTKPRVFGQGGPGSDQDLSDK